MSLQLTLRSDEMPQSRALLVNLNEIGEFQQSKWKVHNLILINRFKFPQISNAHLLILEQGVQEKKGFLTFC